MVVVIATVVSELLLHELYYSIISISHLVVIVQLLVVVTGEGSSSCSDILHSSSGRQSGCGSCCGG